MREFALLAGRQHGGDLARPAVRRRVLARSVRVADARRCSSSLAVYSGARQWILNQLLGSSMLTTERMFEQLYRIAREVEAHPERTAALLGQLLRELFEPMEVMRGRAHARRTRVSPATARRCWCRCRFRPTTAAGARRRRSRSASRSGAGACSRSEDARLTDRIVEQLRRAVAYRQGRRARAAAKNACASRRTCTTTSAPAC